MRRSQELPPRCPKPTHELLQLLTRPWTMHILWVLSTAGPTRFGALRRQIDGISSRLLTERLRDLEEKGFIYRVVSKYSNCLKLLVRTHQASFGTQGLVLGVPPAVLRKCYIFSNRPASFIFS